MVRLANFLYCLNAERKQISNEKGELLNANGVISVMTPEFIPGMFSFSIVFSILGVLTQNNEIQITFKHKTGKELVRTEEITLPPIPTNGDIKLPPEYLGYNLSMDFRNIVFEVEGEYETVVSFNKAFIGSIPIYVKGKKVLIGE